MGVPGGSAEQNISAKRGGAKDLAKQHDSFNFKVGVEPSVKKISCWQLRLGWKAAFVFVSAYSLMRISRFPDIQSKVPSSAVNVMVERLQSQEPYTDHE